MSSKPSFVLPLSLPPLLLIISGNAPGADNHRLYVPVPNSPAGGPTPVFSEAVMTGVSFTSRGTLGGVQPRTVHPPIRMWKREWRWFEIADVAMVSSNAS